MNANPRRSLTWIAYTLMLAQGFAVYGVSYLTPYMSSELGVPTWAASAPNGAMAIGFLVAAFLVPVIGRRIGAEAAVRTWALLMAVAAVLTASASFPFVVLGGLLIGIGSAGTIVHTVASIGSQRNGLYMVRASVWSMTGGLLSPLVLWVATRSLGWNTGILVVVPFAIAVAGLVRPRGSTSSPDAAPVAEVTHGAGRVLRAQRLGGAYWAAWWFLVLMVGTEFAFVAWGAQVAVVRTGLPLAEATALASLLTAGELVGRLAWGLGLAARVDRVHTLRGIAVLTLAGAIVLGLAPNAPAAAAGLLLGGLGLSLAFPVTSSVALSHAHAAPVQASAWLNLSWGVAILVAPMVLGLVASGMGVAPAWLLVPILLIAAVAVALRVPRPAAEAQAVPLPDRTLPLDAEPA